jgi:DNA-binding response OmpR family regulator
MSELAVVPRRSFGEVSFSSVGSVLIIDDEAEIRESLRTLLELEGYEVDVAGSADEGASRLGERAFDLVLLDLALPIATDSICSLICGRRSRSRRSS